MTRILSSRISWAALFAVAAGLLVLGSINPPVSSAAARISRLDSIIKCPACEDLSIAQSAAPSAVTLRNQVAGWVRHGWSNAQVEQAVVADYGPGGLLLPPAAGLDRALYLVPLGAIGAAGASLGWFFWRRQRRGVVSHPDGHQ